MARSSRGTRARAATALGSAMALSAGAVWSFGAVTARLADESDTFQYLFWRSLGIIAVIECWYLLKRRPSQTLTAYTSGPRMLLANLALWLASIGFVYAVKTTSAANAAFLGATTPLFGVAAARAFLGERLNWRTITAIVVAFVGLTIMLAGHLEQGALIGDLAAISAAIGFALYTTIVRSAPERDWAPVLPGYAVAMVAICAPIIAANDKAFVPPALDIFLAVLHGGLFVVAGMLLYNSASRSVPAATMTVFAQTEMVLVPVWGFVLLAERPEPSTVLGGTIILVAVLAKAVLDARHEMRLQHAAPPAEPLLAPAG
ncbi:MAG TPA: DMT family transporter [Ilumatobacter sp.]